MTVARWSDLPPRMYSAMILGAIGFIAIYFGGTFLLIAVTFLVVFMHYELAKMQSPLLLRVPKYSSIVAFFALLVLHYSTTWVLSLIVIAISLVCQYFFMNTQKLAGAVYSMIIILGGLHFMELRSDFGSLFLAWVICVVIMTDTFGYFGGRVIGGPRFFVSISPNKTWAGILSGWVGAWVCTHFFIKFNVFLDFSYSKQILFLFAILLSFCSQIGDLFESFIKRKCKVKDSSNIIPGHGGFMDRFDGIIVATLICGVLGPIVL